MILLFKNKTCASRTGHSLTFLSLPLLILMDTRNETKWEAKTARVCLCSETGFLSPQHYLSKWVVSRQSILLVLQLRKVGSKDLKGIQSRSGSRHILEPIVFPTAVAAVSGSEQPISALAPEGHGPGRSGD